VGATSSRYGLLVYLGYYWCTTKKITKSNES